MSAPASVRAHIGGAGSVVVATIVAGVLAYLITWLVPRVVGFADYAPFAVFWSATYLVVGALGGVGQEIARSTLPATDPAAHPGAARTRTFAIVAAVLVSVLVGATAVLWAPAVFRTEGWALVPPIMAGCSGYVLAASLSGTFAGVGRWRVVASLMVADAVIRTLFVSAVLGAGGGVLPLAWAVALPFPLAAVFTWPLVRHLIIGRTILGVSPRELAANSLRTVIGSVGTSLMITGLPLLIAATSPGASRTRMSLVILSLTLVRAPLVVLAQSLQSYLVVSFRSASRPVGRFVTVIALGLVLMGGVLAVLAVLSGPVVFGLLFPAEPVPDATFLGVLVASSALLAVAFVVASVLLARAAHGWYSFGWVAGAVSTLVVLVLPFALELRVAAAVLLGPVVSLAAWLIYLSSGRARSAGAEPS